MTLSDDSPNQTPFSVVVDQGHARLHYAVPTAVHRANMLKAAVCDYYSDGGHTDRGLRAVVSRFSPATAKRMADRRSVSLPSDLVVQDRYRALILDVARSVSKCAEASHWDRWTAWRAKKLGAVVRRSGADILHGYISSLHPPLLRQLREAGIRLTGDQIIAPTHVLRRENDLQMDRFGDWAPEEGGMDLERLADLERATWPLLHGITCASEFVRAGLVEAGIERERVDVLPYPYARTRERPLQRDASAAGGPLTVGFVGTVSLRKGAPYFLQVARRLASPSLRFRMVGPVQLHERVRRQFEDCVEFVGPVPRGAVSAELAGFDVFLFPSTCEGSAGVIYEAANACVPVITSGNSGTHLRAPSEVLLHPYDDLDAICGAVEALSSSAALRESQAEAAWEALERCSIDAYSQRIAATFRKVMESAQAGSK